jgi:hypothetical protein
MFICCLEMATWFLRIMNMWGISISSAFLYERVTAVVVRDSDDTVFLRKKSVYSLEDCKDVQIKKIYVFSLSSNDVSHCPIFFVVWCLQTTYTPEYRSIYIIRKSPRMAHFFIWTVVQNETSSSLRWCGSSCCEKWLVRHTLCDHDEHNMKLCRVLLGIVVSVVYIILFKFSRGERIVMSEQTGKKYIWYIIRLYK